MKRPVGKADSTEGIGTRDPNGDVLKVHPVPECLWFRDAVIEGRDQALWHPGEFVLTDRPNDGVHKKVCAGQRRISGGNLYAHSVVLDQINDRIPNLCGHSIVLRD